MDEKTKRNKEIYDKKMSGATYRQLSKEYDLSMNRLLIIIKNYSKKYGQLS